MTHPKLDRRLLLEMAAVLGVKGADALDDKRLLDAVHAELVRRKFTLREPAGAAPERVQLGERA